MERLLLRAKRRRCEWTFSLSALTCSSQIAGGAESLLRLLLREAATAGAPELERHLLAAAEAARESQEAVDAGRGPLLLGSWRLARTRRAATHAEAKLAGAAADLVDSPLFARARELAQRRWDRVWVIEALAAILRDACARTQDAVAFLETRAALAMAAALAGGVPALLRVVAAAGRPMTEVALGRLFWCAGSRRHSSMLAAPPPRVFADAIRLGNRRAAAELVGLVGFAGTDRLAALLHVSRVLLRECFAARLKDDNDDDQLLMQAWAFARRAEDAATDDAAPRRQDAAPKGDPVEHRTTDELVATFALNGLIKRASPATVRHVGQTLASLDWTPPLRRQIKYVVTAPDAVLDALVGAYPDLFLQQSDDDDADAVLAAIQNGDKPAWIREPSRLLLVVRAFNLPDWHLLLAVALKDTTHGHSHDDDAVAPPPKLAAALATSFQRYPRARPALLAALDAIDAGDPPPS